MKVMLPAETSLSAEFPITLISMLPPTWLMEVTAMSEVRFEATFNVPEDTASDPEEKAPRTSSVPPATVIPAAFVPGCGIG